MNLIFDKIKSSYKKQLPFVVYRKPNADLLSGFFQQKDELVYTKKFTTSGFVFAPFNNSEEAILIPEKTSDFFQEKICIEEGFEYNNDIENDESSKKSHIQLVEKAITEINKNELIKVVVSRKESVFLSTFNLIEVYKKLLKKYPNAFVYVWFHPRVGLWLGASPETLLHIVNDSFETMSLAGTQVYQGTEKVLWKAKELDEQFLVTKFIESQLSNIISELELHKTETVKAGDLLHLKTIVRGRLKTIEDPVKTLVKALHPTPAVCGLPREKAKEFIISNENYLRTFYTGFLGELNLRNNSSSLFVNLRCMEIVKNSAQIYIGGGITKDSIPLKEWEETVSKSKVMKSVL